MNDLLLTAAAAAVAAGLLTNLLVPLVVRIAEALRALDAPGERKTQLAPVPRLGGLAITVGLALAAGGAAMERWGDWGIRVGRSELVALAIGAGLVFLVGLVDDVVGVSTAKKLLLEVIAAWLLVRVGWSFAVLKLPGIGQLDLGVLADPVSILWIVGVTNAINLLDGLDGLASGVVAIIAASFLAYAAIQGNTLTVLLLAAMVGACLGFLRHNWAPAKIYMGDSGSLTLGFLLAVTSVHSSLKAPATVAILVPLLALGVPVIDTLAVMGVRFLERPKGRFAERALRMFKADRQHLHFLLANVAPRRGTIVFTIYGLVLASCGLALLVAVTGNTTLGLWLVAGEVAVILLVRNLGLVKEARLLALRQRREVRSELVTRPLDDLRLVDDRSPTAGESPSPSVSRTTGER